MATSGRGSFPLVDDHLVEPEVTRDEIINGRRVVAMPAEAPHGDKQVDLDTLLRIHVAPGFIASTDLISRFAEKSDFASDGCVRRAAALRLRGPLDPWLVESSVRAVRDRQGSLRTRFAAREGGPVQIVEPPGVWRLPRIDLDALPDLPRRDEARRLVREDSHRSFDLCAEPLFRPALLRLGGTEHVLILTCHHIITDGWSTGVLIGELTACYAAFGAAVPPPLPELPVQYADLAAGQREQMAGPVLEKQLAYWRDRLAGAPPLLTLPLDWPRPAVQTYRGGQMVRLLPAGLVRALETLSRSATASLYMTLLAGLALLLYRWSGQDDVVIGSPVAGRDRQETEGLIGFFLNVLPLRIDLSGRPTFRELLCRSRDTALDAYAHQEAPFAAHHSLFQVALNMLNLPAPAGDLPAGLTVEILPLEQAESKYDFTIYVTLTESGGLSLRLRYNSDLFDPPRMEELLRQYHLILEQAADDPEAPIGAL